MKALSVQSRRRIGGGGPKGNNPKAVIRKEEHAGERPRVSCPVVGPSQLLPSTTTQRREGLGTAGALQPSRDPPQLSLTFPVAPEVASASPFLL